MSSILKPVRDPSIQTLDKILNDIVENTRVLQDFYNTNSLPGPSFEPTQLAAAKDDQNPRDVEIAKNEIMDSSLLLFDLCSGPSKILSHLTVAVSPTFRRSKFCWLNSLSIKPWPVSVGSVTSMS
jgi:hypothetical protein